MGMSDKVLEFERSLDFHRIQKRIDRREFEECPDCDLCGSNENSQVANKKGFQVVECASCSLWFTSPRLDEKTWEEYLRYPYLLRNVMTTENRLHYGVANANNIGTNEPGGNWRRGVTRRNTARLERLAECLGRPIERLHDVGCGVGFFVQDAMNLGIQATGNDLNGYACRVMREQLGLDVHAGNIGEAPFDDASIDVVFMNDFIEHTYHPLEDLKAAERLLKPGGLLFVETFYLDSPKFDELGLEWNMLTWPHIYHFSRTTLHAMIQKAELTVEHVNAKDNGIVELYIRK